ncbi:uncharacterized protein [Nicotiana sylvestris]|uniref:uncharacterized protein n=1 Tax=Nicotiana sylvestris TaxID=4096 RepID=UPI00388C53ED
MREFYRRFIKEFSKVVNPLCIILEKDAKFYFNDDCMRAFGQLKLKLTTTNIIKSPNWSFPFEFMCVASDVAIGAVLGQGINKDLHLDCYYSKTMNSAQIGMDGVIRRYVPKEEQGDILGACHFSPYVGHHGGAAAKVLSCGFDWPTLYKDANDLNDLQKTYGNVSIPIGVRKKCHLPAEIEHKAMWALKKLNLYWDVAANLWIAHLNKLDEFWYHAYESSSLYKEKIKYLHDKYIWNKKFKAGDLVLLFSSMMRIFPRKLKSKWSGPFEIAAFGALDLKNNNNDIFRVNSH